MDIEILLLLQRFREITHDVFSPFLMHITDFGGLTIAFFFIMLFYWCINKDFGKKLLLACLFCGMTNGIIKLAACVYRPWIRSELIQPYAAAKPSATGYSFPSGSTTNAVFAYGYTGFYYRKYKPLSICLYIFVALIMFSRLYLGVHTPQDVLVGCIATIITIIFAALVTNWMNGKPNRDIQVFFYALILVIITGIWIFNKGFPIDYTQEGKIIVDPVSMWADTFAAMGMLVGGIFGLVLERRFVNFALPSTMHAGIFRAVSGIVMYLFLANVCAALGLWALGTKYWAKCVSGFIATFYCTFVHPFLFTKLENTQKNKCACHSKAPLKLVK